MNPHRRPLIPALLAATALLLAACNDGGTGGADDGTATTATPSTVTSTAQASPPPATTTVSPDPTAGTTDDGPTTQPLGSPSLDRKERDMAWVDPGVLLTGIRTGHHEGFDRVVFDLHGAGEPGWMVDYVEEPTQQGSGHPVEMAGDAYLRVIINGTAYPFDVPDAEELPIGTYPGAGNVAEVAQTGMFEGQTMTYIGLDRQRAYSVTLLQDPQRIVVDIVQ